MNRKLLSLFKNTTLAMGGAIASTIIEGILGNRADTIFVLLWPNIQHTIITNLFLWSLTAVITSACLFISHYCWQQRKVTERAFTTAQKMLEIDDSLLRELASLNPSPQIEGEILRIINGLLRDSTAEFNGLVHHVALLVPDASQNYLYCWANYLMPQEIINYMKFYVGQEQNLQDTDGGVAGKVFRDGELTIGHMTEINGAWVCEDNIHYKRFPGRHPYPPYLSFASVPVIGILPNPSHFPTTTCLAVLCFDSLDKHVFDSEASQTILRTFARRIAATLLIYDLYKKIPSCSGTP